ncbi:MAG: FtsW/RodA/SpoVE family cell cycle protein [Tannerella sp.]|jgi:cell division protein FtsW|nr:FtsW/RodA/SpoVE family cell cycle protein [Tannerella sp.]
MELANKLFKGDRVVWVIFMFLCLISLVEVYSATSTLAYKNAYYWSPIARHATFLFIGFGAVLLLHNIPSKYYSFAVMFLPVAILMLAVTPFIGVRANDAARWLEFGGISFQPSEIAKLLCIIFVAFVLSKQEKYTPDKTFWIIIVGVGITCALIFPENFSTALILFVVCITMMFVGQAPLKKLFLLCGALVLSGILLIFTLEYLPKSFVKEHLPDRLATWQSRIEDFGSRKDSTKFAFNDSNYQVTHASIAIARGGIIGKLPGRSLQRDFLPQAYSDFIYAIIIEEMGLAGGIFVLLLYVVLMFRVAIIARRCDKLFPKYLVLGCGLLIVIQAFINMAVAVRLIPVTGQPLPLISRGGTSTVLTCVYFGIILSVSRFGAKMGDEDLPEIEAETEPEPELANDD